MNSPTVKVGDWIKIKSNEKDSGIDGCVLEEISEGEKSVGYYQNNTNTIKEDVVWDGAFWKFKYSGLISSNVKSQRAAIKKRGAHR